MLKPEKRGIAKVKAAAAARKKAVELERQGIKDRDEEDRHWQEAEGPKSRSAMKREEETRKRAEAAARKAERRRVAEEEEKELERNLNKKRSKKMAKVTEAELRRTREEDQAGLRKKVEEAKRRQSRVTTEEEYERTVLVKNTNLDDSILEARTIEDAIAQLTMEGYPNASWKAFIKAEVFRLKAEKPGLRNDQYKDMATKNWKRSHLNKENQTTNIWQKFRTV